MIHEVKTVQPYFDDVAKCVKTFEIRKNDRVFVVGDFLALNEFNDVGYTGKCMIVRITYMLQNSEYCKEGFVTLGIEPATIMTHRWLNLQEPPKCVRNHTGIPVYDCNS